MSEQKNHFLSVLIVSIGGFLGFEALSLIIGLYQPEIYLKVAFWVYIFHVCWLTLMFDLHYKKRGILTNLRFTHSGWRLIGHAFKERFEHVKKWEYLRHFQNYLILPGIIYWSVVVMLFLNPFRQVVKQIIVLLASLGLTIVYWYFKKVFSKKMESHEPWIKILGLVKIFAAFYVFAGCLGLAWYFNLGGIIVWSVIFSLSFLLLYQALFQHSLLYFRILLLAVVIAIFVALVAVIVYNYWETNYLTGAMVVLAVYNSLWGMLHHHLDRTLTKKLAFEYVLIMFLAISILLASHDFGAKVL